MDEPAGAVLITGAAKRLGAAMALDVARAGRDVALHCHRSRAEAEALAATIRGLGRRAVVVSGDLAREAEAARLVPEAARAIGPLGVLVNNASTFELDHLATADRDSWDRHLETNLRAPIVLSQAFVRQLPPAGDGLIVNLLDQRVMNLTPNYLSYSISKAGLWAATQVLARELAPRVRVNAIGPGPALPSPGLDRHRFEELCRATPLQRGTSPEEIAAALRFIMASPSMTGQLIVLDGGQQMGWLTPRAPEVD
jgi:NAD(P)-dependent dehydrogenase (short-subunit alcohol dehydrogenase family)